VRLLEPPDEKALKKDDWSTKENQEIGGQKKNPILDNGIKKIQDKNAGEGLATGRT